MAMVEREFRMKRDTGGRNDKGNQVLEIRENTSVIQREHIIKKKKQNWENPIQPRARTNCVCTG